MIGAGVIPANQTRLNRKLVAVPGSLCGSFFASRSPSRPIASGYRRGEVAAARRRRWQPALLLQDLAAQGGEGLVVGQDHGLVLEQRAGRPAPPWPPGCRARTLVVKELRGALGGSSALPRGATQLLRSAHLCGPLRLCPAGAEPDDEQHHQHPQRQGQCQPVPRQRPGPAASSLEETDAMIIAPSPAISPTTPGRSGRSPRRPPGRSRRRLLRLGPKTARRSSCGSSSPKSARPRSRGPLLPAVYQLPAARRRPCAEKPPPLNPPPLNPPRTRRHCRTRRTRCRSAARRRPSPGSGARSSCPSSCRPGPPSPQPDAAAEAADAGSPPSAPPPPPPSRESTAR